MYFSHSKWSNLVELRLCIYSSNKDKKQIGPKGYKYLAKSYLPVLESTQLYTDGNQMDEYEARGKLKKKYSKNSRKASIMNDQGLLYQ